jgi:hypothetical protein
MARSSSGNSLKIFRTKDDQFFDWETSVRIAYGLLKTSRVRETVTRLAHNQKIVGSTPTPATKKNKTWRVRLADFLNRRNRRPPKSM